MLINVGKHRAQSQLSINLKNLQQFLHFLIYSDE